MVHSTFAQENAMSGRDGSPLGIPKSPSFHSGLDLVASANVEFIEIKSYDNIIKSSFLSNNPFLKENDNMSELSQLEARIKAFSFNPFVSNANKNETPQPPPQQTDTNPFTSDKNNENRLKSNFSHPDFNFDNGSVVYSNSRNCDDKGNYDSGGNNKGNSASSSMGASNNEINNGNNNKNNLNNFMSRSRVVSSSLEINEQNNGITMEYLPLLIGKVHNKFSGLFYILILLLFCCFAVIFYMLSVFR